MEVRDYVLKRKEEIRALVQGMERKPCLIIIQVNDDPASNAYVRGKLKDGAELGLDVRLDKLPETTSEEELLAKVKEYNENKEVDGLIVQLPLPRHIDEGKVKLAVDPKKDVDGFHPLTAFIPCTPKGIVEYLQSEGFPFQGKNAVVIGRSNIVGKPLAAMLMQKAAGANATVTVVHSGTKDIAKYTRDADILISFYAYSAAALFFRWLESGMPLSSGENFSKYCMILDESVNALLLKFSK